MNSLSLPIRIVGIAGLISVVICAFFYRTEATGFTFATGDFNLKLDSTATWNGVLQPQSTWALKNLVPGVDRFFKISDVKPGDQGEATISFHVNKNAWICLDFFNLRERENGENEPEALEDTGFPSQAELADGTEFFAWHDDGDNLFEIGEKPIFGTSTDKQAAVQVLKNTTYVLADSLSGTAYSANQMKYIGIQWCAGDMVVDVAMAVVTCDATALGNEAQTDSFSVDIGFRAVPSNNETRFRCDKGGMQCERSGCNGNCNNSVNITVTNTGTINSTTTSSSNTGGNSAGAGGTVLTGDASSTSNSTTILNVTRIMLDRLRGR